VLNHIANNEKNQQAQQETSLNVKH